MFKFATPGTWAYSLEASDHSQLSNPLPLAEEAVMPFYVDVSVPSSETNGTSGEADLLITGEVYDGGAYAGANGIIFGGPDTLEAMDVLTIEALANLRINRNDINKDFYITWNGGNADIYMIEGSYEASFAGATVEARNVSSPYYCNNLSVKDGKTRYYRAALANTSSFATQTVGKFDDPIVGDPNIDELNQLSCPLIIYENDLAHLIGTQVTGGQSNSASDTLWKYTNGNARISWLVSGTGTEYDGHWMESNSYSTVTIGSDEGWYLNVRAGHPATYVSLIGEVSTTGRFIVVSTGMNMVGTCFPIQVPINNSNIYSSGITGAPNAPSADQVWTYNTSTDGFDCSWVVDNVNPSINGEAFMGNHPSTMKFTPGKGYWIEVQPNHSGFIWSYPKPY